MNEILDELEDWQRKIHKERDELNLQMHLAGSELREEWRKVDAKWEHFRARAERARHAGAESAEDIGEALKILGEEIRRAFRNIRDAL